MVKSGSGIIVIIGWLRVVLVQNLESKVTLVAALSIWKVALEVLKASVCLTRSKLSLRMEAKVSAYSRKIQIRMNSMYNYKPSGMIKTNPCLHHVLLGELVLLNEAHVILV